MRAKIQGGEIQAIILSKKVHHLLKWNEWI